ncbi:apoptosis-associated speck-like protein containing a CARD [Stigmatopora argus]
MSPMRFCVALVDRRGERRVSRSKVEKQSRVEVTNVLVSTFPEAQAPAVGSWRPSDSGIAQLTSNASGGQGAGQLGVANARKSSISSRKHFLDEHRLKLIQRVTNIDPILDGLLDQDVLLEEAYEEISQTAGNQNKMRKIYQLALKSGDDAKDVFMELLRQKEPYLVKDLLKDPLKDPSEVL